MRRARKEASSTGEEGGVVELGTRGLTHVYSKDNFFYPVQYGGERGVIGIMQ